ncbi:hypothetical protein KIN20_022820 [Parelaphostrongylus tenuis]|uniref:Uncharacterized protein n=1 Tax=Parelaphostrongylus tenuis TaxID=148309 RepID=A0AAD5QVM3_PARTN|nr:hypothetical protein KIN20_022820 [Parelaphostrongylus tenuis]
MLQGMAVSADEDIGNESDASMDKNIHTSQGSEDDDYGTGDAQRALLNAELKLVIGPGDWTTNAQPPTVLPFYGSSGRCPTQYCYWVPATSLLLRTAHDRSLGIDCRASKYLRHSEERRLRGYHCEKNEDILM